MNLVEFLLLVHLCVTTYQMVISKGGPSNDNFGMINLLRNNSNFKINDNDNNNNINLSTMNNNNTIIIYKIRIINKN